MKGKKMNDVIDEINDRLNSSVKSVDMEIKEDKLVNRDFEFYQAEKLKKAPELVQAQIDNNREVVIDDYSGEYRRYRSASALGKYTKKEICINESETDSKMYEPLETTIEKCSRAPLLRKLMQNNLLFQDGEEAPDMDADFDETTRQGYDLTDAAETMVQIGEAIATPNKATNEVTSAKPNEVGSSEAKAE